MMKILSVILIIILMSFSVHAIKISVEPAHINLSGRIGEKLCQEVKVSSDEKTIFLADDKWSLNNEKGNFNGYDLTSGEIGLATEYRKTFSSGDKFNFCVGASEVGKYYGIVLFKTSAGNAVIGSLVKIEVGENKERDLTILSGMIMISLALCLILGLMIYYMRRS